MTPSDGNEPSHKTLLVVTHTPEDIDALREELGNEGYDIEQTWDAEKALKRVGEEPPDLVLLDVDRDARESIQFCERLRERQETAGIPVLIIANERGRNQDEAVLRLGADGFICRPFDRVELLGRIRTLLRMKTLLDRVAEQNHQLLQVNAELDRLNQELLTRNRELELGMDMARRLQDALMPQSYPRVKNVSFSHKYVPADAIGGDVFHIMGLDEARAAIFVADVSGHGVRAAIVSSIVKTVIDYIDFHDKTPTEVLSDFNSRFRSVLGPMTPQIYATAVMAIVDGESRRLSVASAGHPAPLLVSKREMCATPIMTLDDLGPALGFLRDPEYPTVEVQLSAQDIVLCFTDGLYEVANPQGEMFTLARLQELVGANAHLVPRDLIQRIITETEEFMGAAQRPDDLCVVAIEVS